MIKNLLFEPQKILQTKAPFSFFEKITDNKKVAIVYTDFDKNQLAELFVGEQLRLLNLLSEDAVEAQRKQIFQNYKKVNLSIDLEVYLYKYLSHYLFDSFRKNASFLSQKNLFHKVQTSQKGFTVKACIFDFETPVALSFKLSSKNKKLLIQTYFIIQDELFDSKEINQFSFLIFKNNTYYFLRKLDWQLLEELNQITTITRDEFITTYYKKLKSYPLDTSEVFEEEVREIIPDTLIKVSELGGNMLLFIPSWDYDGTVVDNDKASFEIFEADKKLIYKRNQAVEQQTIDFLQQAHPNFKGQKSFYLSFAEASKKNWFFNFYHGQLKDNFSVVGMDMLGYFRYSQHAITSHFKIIKTIDNEVVAEFKTFFGKEKIALKSLQKALFEHKKFVLLKDSSLGIITDDWMADYALILKYATINNDEITFAKWILIASESSSSYQKNLKMVLPENWMQRWEQWNHTNDSLYPVSKNVNATLRNYQQKGYEWINLMAEVNAGTLLADDMGLGKTLQTIASIVYWLEENPNLKVFVVCPSSLIYNWKMEFEKFAPSVQLSIYHGAERDFTEFLESKNNVLISSYAIVRNDISQLTKLVWDAIVLDESHNIKNYQAQQTKAVLTLMGKRRIILNGTPIMNSVADLFPQLSFLLPQLFYSQKKFRDDFEKPIQKTLAQSQMQTLQKLTNPFILRRTKEIAAPDLPQKTESVMWCDMNDDQRGAYETLKKQIKRNILVEISDKGLNKAKLGVLQGITKLRQVCSSPQLLKEYEDFKNLSSVKIDNLIELLTANLKDNKVIVFSQFIGTMELLSKSFEQKGIKYLSFSGSTKPEKRIQLVTEFQDKNSDIQVFLLSLMAGNSGINLTQANYVFLVEPWWNRAVQQQAIDRVHRIGQEQHVFAYNMICKDTIEEKIIALQNKKQFISDEVIGNDEGFVKNLNEEDIAFLFE